MAQIPIRHPPVHHLLREIPASSTGYRGSEYLFSVPFLIFSRWSIVGSMK